LAGSLTGVGALTGAGSLTGVGALTGAGSLTGVGALTGAAGAGTFTATGGIGTFTATGGAATGAGTFTATGGAATGAGAIGSAITVAVLYAVSIMADTISIRIDPFFICYFSPPLYSLIMNRTTDFTAGTGGILNSLKGMNLRNIGFTAYRR
jgi:hypothetical protein